MMGATHVKRGGLRGRTRMDEERADSGRRGHAQEQTLRRVPFSAGPRAGRAVAVVLAASMAAGMTGADPFDDYRGSCSEPATSACEALRRQDRRARCDADQILSTVCTEFLGRLGGLERPTREERLVLIRGRTWVHQLRDDLGEDVEDELCGERRALAQDHPEYAEVWYELTRCTENRGEWIALLQKALVIDPEKREFALFPDTADQRRRSLRD